MPLLRRKRLLPCLLLTSTLLLAGTMPPHPQGRAATVEELQQQLQKKQQELENLRKQAERVQGQLQDRQRRRDATLRELGRLERRIEATEAELGRVQAQLAEAEARLVQTTRDLESAERELARRTDLLGRRLRAIYEHGTVTYLDVLLAASDFADFLSRFENLRRIVSADALLLRQVTAQRDQVARLKAQQEAEKARVAAVITQVSSTIERLQEDKVAKEEVKERLNKDIEALRRAYDELEQQSRQITADLQRLQKELEKQLGETGAILLSPPVNGRLTSGFGPRFHPVLRQNRMHTGIDYGVPHGTPVRAAAAGVVFLADWYGGYGKTVILVHGKGISTLYAHLSAIQVTKGQRVEKGQVIGLVGSTGLSTGPHCHFEVRVNGEPRNPLDYLGKLIQ